MLLNRFNLKNIKHADLQLPPEQLFDLPEKVLQFGTGVLLRALPDYFIDKANRQGIFNGRIVVLKSTDRGDVDAFAKQDGLYTICVRGLEAGQKKEENIINASISRVLSAKRDWPEFLRCAHNPNLQVIISNTTEVGIQLIKEDIHQQPPASYPGKLLAFLYERYMAFKGSRESGMVIIPTELIPDNGTILKSILVELSRFNGLEDQFIDWLEHSNSFCSSLVDRIVPGKPDAKLIHELEQAFGYSDELLTMSEVYRLWAIEGNDMVRSILSFAAADRGVVISPDIDQFRELKLRMLNATHTLSCGLAFLAGIETVREGMEDGKLSGFIRKLMMDEIAVAIPYKIEQELVRDFGEKVLDRFRNPYIEHHWISITMQYTSKMRMRVIPVLQRYLNEHETVPAAMALGFAAYLLYTKPQKRQDDAYFGQWKEKEYLIKDDYAAYFYEKWNRFPAETVAKLVLSDSSLWGSNCTAGENFIQVVIGYMRLMMDEGVRHAIQICQENKVLV